MTDQDFTEIGVIMLADIGERFTPHQFDTEIGEPVNADGGLTGTIVAVDVENGGRSAAVTLEVPSTVAHRWRAAGPLIVASTWPQDPA